MTKELAHPPFVGFTYLVLAARIAHRPNPQGFLGIEITLSDVRRHYSPPFGGVL